MKNRTTKQSAAAFLVGFIFAMGLAFSGMTQPQNVIGFLDPLAWNPSLMLVMLGALVVHTLAYPLVRKRPSPLLDTQWHVPNRKDTPPRLILGSALFGIGWGIAGFCPGPAVTSLVAGDRRVVAFVVAMLLGMFLFKKTEPFLGLKE